MPKIKLYVHTGLSNASHEDYEEVDDAKWAAMSEKEREEMLDEMAREFMGNNIDFGAFVVEGEDE
jgi:hypothetical protein